MALPSMARFLKIAAVYAFILGVVGLPILFKIWLLPQWRDLPRPDNNFSLLMLFEDTVYGPSFSESGFSMLRLGMKKDDVVRIMGESARVVRRSQGGIVEMQDWKDGSWHMTYSQRQALPFPAIDSETYHYSRAGEASDHWYVRAVTFSSKGLVIRISKDFY